MQILVKRIKLFCHDHPGEAPAGSEWVFNILDNAEFQAKYGHMNYRNFPVYAAELVKRWNTLLPAFWKYELAEPVVLSWSDIESGPVIKDA